MRMLTSGGRRSMMTLITRGCCGEVGTTETHTREGGEVGKSGDVDSVWRLEVEERLAGEGMWRGCDDCEGGEKMDALAEAQWGLYNGWWDVSGGRQRVEWEDVDQEERLCDMPEDEGNEKVDDAQSRGEGGERRDDVRGEQGDEGGRARVGREEGVSAWGGGWAE
jgi:hypothetical protein